MISPGFRELMTQGFALSNKIRFGEWNPDEFDQWIRDCRRLLSRCEPEPHLPWFPDPMHIEEIVMILSGTRQKISRGEITHRGLLL